MCAASAWTWKSVPLSLVMTLQSGYSFKSSAWTNTGCPVARIGDIKSAGLRREAMVCVDSRTAAEAASFELSSGDVLVAMTGEVGHVAFVQEQDLPMLVNQRVGLARFSPNSPVVSSRFLYYLCLLPATKQQFVALAHGSVQPTVGRCNIECPRPSAAAGGAAGNYGRARCARRQDRGESPTHPSAGRVRPADLPGGCADGDRGSATAGLSSCLL